MKLPWHDSWGAFMFAAPIRLIAGFASLNCASLCHFCVSTRFGMIELLAQGGFMCKLASPSSSFAALSGPVYLKLNTLFLFFFFTFTLPSPPYTSFTWTATKNVFFLSNFATFSKSSLSPASTSPLLICARIQSSWCYWLYPGITWQHDAIDWHPGKTEPRQHVSHCPAFLSSLPQTCEWQGAAQLKIEAL